jgi:hypothetical protein
LTIRIRLHDTRQKSIAQPDIFYPEADLASSERRKAGVAQHLEGVRPATSIMDRAATVLQKARIGTPSRAEQVEERVPSPPSTKLRLTTGPPWLGVGAFTPIRTSFLPRVPSVGFRAHPRPGGRVRDDRHPAWPATFGRPSGKASDNRAGRQPGPRQAPPGFLLPWLQGRNVRHGPLPRRERGQFRSPLRLVPVTRPGREAHRAAADSGAGLSWNACFLVGVNGGPDPRSANAFTIPPRRRADCFSSPENRPPVP